MMMLAKSAPELFLDSVALQHYNTGATYCACYRAGEDVNRFLTKSGLNRHVRGMRALDLRDCSLQADE